MKAKAGGWGQLEEALKKHFAWHKAQNDSFAWHTWKVMSGDNVGDLVVGTFGHAWKEFDARAELENLARWMPRLEAYFHYRNLDVSTSKELVRRWRPELAKGLTKHGKHEALADIHESIAEMQYYRECT